MLAALRRRIAHWSPRFLWHRVGVLVYEVRHPDHPWLTAEAIGHIEAFLRPDHRALEVGAGRSTAWLAARCGSLVSFETDPAWHSRVQVRLEEAGVAPRVQLILAADGDAVVAGVEDRADASLDFVLVDGAARDRVALRVLEKLSPGGMLVVDNTEIFLPEEPQPTAHWRRDPALGPANEVWAEFQRRVQGWRVLRTTNGVCDTKIWWRAQASA